MTTRRYLLTTSALFFALAANESLAATCNPIATRSAHGLYGKQIAYEGTACAPAAAATTSTTTYSQQAPVAGGYTTTQAPVADSNAINAAAVPVTEAYTTQAPAYYGTQAPVTGGYYGGTTGAVTTQAPAYYGTQAPVAGTYTTQAPAYYGTQAPVTGGYYTTQAPAYYGTQAPATGGYYGTTGTAGSYTTQAPAYYGTQAPVTGGYYGTQAPAYYGTQAPVAAATTQAATGLSTQTAISGLSALGGVASAVTTQAPAASAATTQAAVGGLGNVATTQAPVMAANSASTMASVGGTAARAAVSHAGQFIGSSVTWTGLGVLAAGGGAAALVGGSGGGTGTGGGDDCHETYTCPEYYAQYTLDRYDTKKSYQRGYTGEGSTIAMLDTGLDTNGFEFINRVTGGYDFVLDRAGMPASGAQTAHGTQVAGVIASNRNDIGMHGVAFDAMLMPLRVFDNNNVALPQLGLGSFAPAIDYARVNGANILNGSYGPDTRWHLLSESRNYQIITDYDLEEGAAYVRAAQAGMILVFPAGNDYLNAPNTASNPTGPGFLPFISAANKNLTGVANGAYRSEDGGAVINADFSAMKPLTIVVVGIDRNDTIAAYSNRCGVAKDWCMAAYSEGIYTTTTGGQYTTVSGTSYAAPQVAGAAALLRQAFPSLTSEQIVARLLATADDLGEAGVDAIYGHGKLNLDRATQPLGQTTFAVGNNLATTARYELKGSSLSYGKAFGLTATTALQGQSMVFFDSQDVPFQIAMGEVVSISAPKFHADDALFAFGRNKPRMENKMNDSLTVAFNMDEKNTVDDFLTADGPKEAESPLDNMRSFTVTNRISESTQATVHFKDAEALSLGFSEEDRARFDNAINKDSLQNPYAAFTSAGYASIIKTEALGGTTRVAGFFGSSKDDEDARNFGTQIETSYKLADNSNAFLSVGSLFEENRVLGSKGEGAFGFGNGTTTIYSGIGAKFDLGSNFSLKGAAYAGWTDPSLSKDSLVTDASSIITTSFNASVQKKGVRKSNDTLSFGIAQPLRVESGNMSFYVPYARSATTTEIFSTNLTQDLSAQGREIDLEVTYALPLDETQSISAGALYRMDAGHVSGNQDMLGVVRWNKKF